jgi:hypothetical protein
MEDDERVSLKPLKPTQALKALLDVEPGSAEEPERCSKTWEGKRCSLRAGHLGPCRFDIPA